MMIIPAIGDLLLEGFRFETPTEVGTYLAACNETDYEKYNVEIFDDNGTLVVNDPEIGTCNLTGYDLTELMWKPVTPSN